MRHTQSLLAIFLLSTSLAGFAKTPVSHAIHTANNLSPSTLSYPAHPGGWELGVTAGYDRVNTGQRGQAYGPSYTYSHYANATWGVHGGYYWAVAKRLLLGVETGYQSYGGASMVDSDESITYKTRSIDAWRAMLAARFYVLNRLALFGKLGGAYTWIDLKTSGGVNTTEMRQFINPTWQLGVLMDLGQHVSATLAFDRLVGHPGSEYAGSYNPDVMGVLAGLNWRINDAVMPVVASAHPGGWELGATAGYDRVNTGQTGQAFSPSRTYSHYGNATWGVHGGYYWAVAKRLLLGVETGYQSYGGAKRVDFDTSTTYKTRSIDAWRAMLAARFYVLNRLALFGKLGGAYTRIDLKTSGAINTTEMRQFFNPTWQLGVLMDLGQHASATLAFDRLVGHPASENTGSYNPDVMGVLAGLNWRINDAVMPVVASAHPGGWELGASVGYDRVNTGQTGQAFHPTRTYSHYGNATWGVHGGYYWAVAKRLLLGVETGYQSYGGAKRVDSFNSTTYKTRSIDAWRAMLAARFYVLNRLALFGKLGGAYTWIDLKTSGGINTTEMRQFINPTWQLGVLMDLGQHVSATLAFDRLVGHPGSENVGSYNPDVMGVLAGLNWRINDAVMPVMTSAHPGGWELGATVGYDRVNTGQTGQAFNPRYTYSHYGNATWGVHGGYYWAVAKRLLLGVETGYQSYGGASMVDSDESITYKTRSIDAWRAMLAARFYVLNRLALFGKLGGAYTWIDLKTSGGINATEMRQFINPTWQLGVLMDLGQHVSATLAFDRLVGHPGSENVGSYNPDVMGVLVGFNVKF